MKVILAIVSFALGNGALNAQFALPEAASVRSHSGQFVVYAGRLPSPESAPPALVTNTSYVELEASLLAVSCERIKQALWTELDARVQWSGRIHLTLRAVQSEDDPVTIVSERFRSGWSYRVQLPQFMKRERFVRAIVQTLLLERANRAGPGRSAEIPFWLTEGLTRHLLDTRADELILTNPRVSWRGLDIGPLILEERRRDPLESARQRLREHPPLTLEELSWPAGQTLAGDAGERFGCSAQLFVTELLRLNGGRACFRAMLDELAGCYNWQTAFFHAFQQHFAKQLDLEKWWELQLAHFTGRDPTQLWTAEESWRKLNDILRTPVEVRQVVNELPVYVDVPLQAVIKEWDSLRQKPILIQKLRDLEIARLRVAPEFIGLVEDYHQLLSNFIRQREQEGSVLPVAGISLLRAGAVTRETVKRLDELEGRRLGLRSPPNPPAREAQGVNPPLTLRNTDFPLPPRRNP